MSRDIHAVANRLGETYGRPFIDDIMPLTSSEQFGPIRVIALAVVSTSAWLSITLLPYEVSTLSVGYHVGPVGAGWIAAAELLAVACAASYVGQSIAGRDKRRLTILGVAIALGASIGCLFADHIVILIALRLLFGVGTGIIAAATNALPTLHEAPERLFAYMQLALGVVFGLAIFVVGAVESFAGRGAVFVVDFVFLLPSHPRPSCCRKGSSRASPSSNRMSAPSRRCRALLGGPGYHVDCSGCSLGVCGHGGRGIWNGR